MSTIGIIEKISDNAFFVIDIRSFSNSIIQYNPLIANQTICCEPCENIPEEKPVNVEINN